MSSANPLSTPTTDHKPREPSMEEILASIRRIIADDQSFPGHVTVPEPQPARPATPSAEAPAPTSTPVSPPVHHGFDVASVGDPTPPQDLADAHAMPSEANHGGTEDMNDLTETVRQYGSIAAPQFPSPNRAINDDALLDAARYNDRPAQFEAAPIPPSTDVNAEHEAMHPVSELPRAVGNPEGAAIPGHRLAEHGVSEGYEQAYDAPIEHGEPDEPADPPALFSDATDASIQSAFNMLAASRLADNSDELKSMVRDMIRPLLRSWLDDNLPSMVERMVRAEIERAARGRR